MHHQLISKLLFGVAVAVGCGVAAAAPASADTDAVSPFSGVHCNCQPMTAADGPARQQGIHRGIREGLTGLPG